VKKLIRITTVPESLKTLLKGQLKFMNQCYDVLAVSSDGECFEEMLEQQNVEGVRINMTRQITPLKDLVALFELICLFRREKPFVVHTHTPKAGILGMLAARIAGVPNRLHTVAGLPLLLATGNKRRLLNFVEKITYCCATKIYPNSFEMQKIIIDNELTKAEKTKVLANGSSNGIDTSFFSPEKVEGERDKIRTELQIPDGVFVFCYVGRLVRDKGINELVKAFVSLYAEKKGIRLLLVGQYERKLDPLNEETEQFISNHPGILYVGPQNDVRPYLVASDALAFPSYREGFPNVVIQAGAMGLPSIVTNINGCNEIILEGKNGVIIPSKDEFALYNSMIFFLENKDVVQMMASNARSLIVSRYEQSVVWNALLKEYQSLE